MKKDRDFQIFNGFILKIIGTICMTLDHLGVFLENYEKTRGIALVFRCFGRIALPLFVYLIVEGMRHTKHAGKYLMRIGILEGVFLIGQLGYYFIIDKSNAFTSPILDLFLVAITLYLLKREDKYSFFAILPVLYFVFDFTIGAIEFAKMKSFGFYPFFLRPDYSIFSLLLALAFYYAKPLSILFLKSNNETEVLTSTPYQRYAESILCCLFLLVITLSFYVLFEITGYSYSFNPIQVYACFAAIPIILYNGKRGYNAKWFQYGSYIYIPAHLILLYLIFSLI